MSLKDACEAFANNAVFEGPEMFPGSAPVFKSDTGSPCFRKMVRRLTLWHKPVGFEANA
jgi:hypothetical protein